MTPEPTLPLEQRKQLLILQGQVFRAGVVQAQGELLASLEPKALLGNVLSNVVGAGAARQIFSVSSLLDGRLNILLPVLLKTVGFLARRKLLKPVGLVATAGAVGWSVYRAFRKPASVQTPTSMEDEAGQASAQ